MGACPPPALCVLLFWFGVVLSHQVAVADGKVFRSERIVSVTPDQEAVIAFSNGVQTMALRTRATERSSNPDSHAAGTLRGSASDHSIDAVPAAWVVPVPGPDAPVILTCSESLFDVARAVTQPRLDDQRGTGLGGMTIVAGFTALALSAATFGRHSLLSSQRAALAMLLLVLGAVLLFVLAVPSLARARSSLAPLPSVEGVQVLAHQRVGTLDVAVISAERTGSRDSAHALALWLRAAGCGVPVSAEPAMAQYAREGWVFVAARLAPSPLGGRIEPSPLVLQFKVSSPIYPMRLTGVQNGPLTLELTIIARGTASVPGMRVARSSPLEAPPAADPTMMNPGLHDFITHAGTTDWITRLTGRLSPLQQTDDLQIAIEPPARIRESLYTPGGAARHGVDIGCTLAGLGFFVLSILILQRTWTLHSVLRWAFVCLACGMLASFVVAASVPRYTGEIRVQNRRWEVLHAIRDLNAQSLQGLRDAIAARRAAGDQRYVDLPPEGDWPNGYALREEIPGVIVADLYGERGQLIRQAAVISMTADAGSKQP